MLLKDIIDHTQSVLPLFTDKFTTNISITSVSKSGNDVSVAATAHGLSVSDQVLISNVRTDIVLTDIRNFISITTLTLSGTTATATSAGHTLETMDIITTSGSDQGEYNGRFSIKKISDDQFSYQIAGAPVTPATGAIIGTLNNIAIAKSTVDHDITPGYITKVTITSAEAAFNGTFDLVNTPTPVQTTFRFKITATPAAPSTGTLHTFHNLGFNGVQTVTSIIDANNFEFQITDSRLTTGSGGGMLLMKKPRISGAADLDTLIESYTKIDANGNPLNPLFGFFIFNGIDVSKDRNLDNDATIEIQTADDYKIRLINNFSFIVFVPTKNEISGREAVDLCQELSKPIYKTLVGFLPPNEFVSPQSVVVAPISQNILDYNRAYLVYEYAFQVTEFISSSANPGNVNEFLGNTGDVLASFDTRAFRKFNSQIVNEFDTIIKNDEYYIQD